MPPGCRGRSVPRQAGSHDGAERSYLIKKAVAEYIALQRWQIEEVQRAVAEADAGQFATDKQVRAAFDELRR